MKQNTKQLTDGALLAALYAILFAIVTYMPFLDLVLMWFLALPFIVYTWRYGRKPGIFFFIVTMMLSFFVNPGLFMIPIGFIFGLIGLVVGELYQKEAKMSEQILKGTIAATAGLTLFLLAARFLLNVNIFKQSMDQYRLMMKETQPLLKQLGQDPLVFEEMINQAIQLMMMLTPTFIVSLGALFTTLSIFLTKPILKRIGFDVPKGEPFRLFSFPRFFAIYYAIVLFFMLFTKPESTLYLFVINLYYIFMILMVIQGIALLMALMYKKGLSIGVQRLIIAVLFLLIFPIEFIHILGIIDVAFDLRKRINRKD